MTDFGPLHLEHFFIYMKGSEKLASKLQLYGKNISYKII